MALRDSDLNLNGQDPSLFAVAPAADPKSLLGAIDVPCKMSGNLKFSNFENSILKLNFILSNFKLS